MSLMCLIVVSNLDNIIVLDKLEIMREKNLELMQHQLDALLYVKERIHSYLALDMGLGKTAIGLRIAPSLGLNMTWVICPGYLRNNWFAEALMWGYQEKEVQIILTRTAKLQYKRLTISSYDAKTIKNIMNQAMWFDVLICDEAHYLGGKSSQRTKCITGSDKRVKNVATRCASRTVYMSGTPMLNRPRELWAILRAVYPENTFLQDYYQYAYRYCIGYGIGGEIDDSGACNLEELKEKFLSPFMLRVKKEEVLSLPEKVLSLIHI